MIRKIIRIDKEKCTGCGLCAAACQEGAIGMVNGKAKLLRDDYCDGLGNCLPACPAGAISFVEREAAAFDEAAVRQNLRRASGVRTSGASELTHWPVQIKLAAANAPWLDGCDLLVAADCTAYAYAGFHSDFLRGRRLLVGCPKLDGVDYSEKLTDVLRGNDIRSLTVLRMQVPCCGGIERAAVTALRNSGKNIPLKIAVVGTDGTLLEER